MVVWNRQLRNLLWIVIGSALGAQVIWTIVGYRSEFLETDPLIDLILEKLELGFAIVFYGSLAAFIVALGSDRSPLAVTGRVTAAIMAVFWIWFVRLAIAFSSEGPGPMPPEDIALLVGTPIIGILGAYFGFCPRSPN